MKVDVAVAYSGTSAGKTRVAPTIGVFTVPVMLRGLPEGGEPGDGVPYPVASGRTTGRGGGM